MKFTTEPGFTLIELLLALAVMVILVVIAVPSFVDTLERRQIINATQGLTGQLQQARSLAVTRNRNVSMVVRSDNAGQWCFGLFDGDPAAPCECDPDPSNPPADEDRCWVTLETTDDPDAERVEIIANQSAYPGVTLSVAGSPVVITFEPTRGLRRGPAAVAFDFEAARTGVQTRVSVNLIGRITTCSPSGSRLAGGIGPC